MIDASHPSPALLTQEEVDALLSGVQGLPPWTPEPFDARAAPALACVEADDPAELELCLEKLEASGEALPAPASAWSKIAQAAIEHDRAGCLLLLARAWPFDDRPRRRSLWLELSAQQGSFSCLAALLGEGDEPPPPGKACPALLSAASYGRIDCLRGLAPSRDPQGVDEFGADAFYAASQSRREDCFLLLLGRLGDPFRRNSLGWSPLDQAARHGFMPGVRACLAMGDGRADPMDLSKALGVAMAMGHGEVERALAERASALRERELLAACVRAGPRGLAAPARAL